uniref:Uncharacterized protein n=1 Tax=Steinernema glaseri TaxID=37863 RepID=A0A1I7Y9Q8_9BILA
MNCGLRSRPLLHRLQPEALFQINSDLRLTRACSSQPHSETTCPLWRPLNLTVRSNGLPSNHNAGPRR